MSNTNVWQLCPKCNGSGIAGITYSINELPKCDVCNGQKIISTVTGRPPLQPIQAKIPSVTDVQNHNPDKYKSHD